MNIGVKKWSLCSLASLIVGCLFGYGLLWLWFFVSLIFFRSGDSGPSWVNTANDIVLYGGIVVGVIVAEVLFIIHGSKHREALDSKDNE
jgi:hypothetical protein